MQRRSFLDTFSQSQKYSKDCVTRSARRRDESKAAQDKAPGVHSRMRLSAVAEHVPPPGTDNLVC